MRRSDTISAFSASLRSLFHALAFGHRINCGNSGFVTIVKTPEHRTGARGLGCTLPHRREVFPKHQGHYSEGYRQHCHKQADRFVRIGISRHRFSFGLRLWFPVGQNEKNPSPACLREVRTLTQAFAGSSPLSGATLERNPQNLKAEPTSRAWANGLVPG